MTGTLARQSCRVVLLAMLFIGDLRDAPIVTISADVKQIDLSWPTVPNGDGRSDAVEWRPLADQRALALPLLEEADRFWRDFDPKNPASRETARWLTQLRRCLLRCYLFRMKTKNEIGFWYLADIVERSEAVGANKSNPNRRCLTWVNTLLIRAPSLSAAYDKALAIAKKEYTTRYKAVSGRTVQWTVLGISSLVPIYESLKDGSEITWTDKGYMSAKRSEGLVVSKRALLKDASK